MPERPDLRQIAVSLRESLDGLEREALVDILTYVLNEYVVEGPPPLAATQVERLEDLQGLSLAQLVQALQVRLDTPGLDLLKVEGDEVRVQTAGGWVPLQAGRAPAASDRAAAGPSVQPAAPPQRSEGRPGAQFDERGFVPRQAPPAARAPESTGRATADEAALRGRGDLGGGERGVVTAPAPRPRGLSVNGRATSGAAPSQPPAGAQPPQQQGAQQPPAAQPTAPQSPSTERKDDDASSIRFSLLELD
jgi:hypothetical protein